MRDVERAILSLPPDYKKPQEPDSGGDVNDYPRIAKLQSDLLAHALASGQTRVASYMLTKCQSLVRLPWLGYTTLRHHVTIPIPTPTRRSSSESCATFAGGTWKNSPTCSAS